ncbi:uncharacterized protein LOC117325189 isoform X5 [Pecten maximus]|uniref:uncharacterized protein LOC117325189 isoform X4 n=1 Tax=Pecten maximus TaxID=6579 RepID=UPI001458C07F|nr:uncharacterized protein LOC117325189 isoform X4 [Pecten maximus]XP_033737090.1 uncharacterized protein LOC117325189 isoform X5 [Pecten maximus]
MADGNYKCHDCHMNFESMQLLQKHKKKFCVGGNIGDPDNLLLRKGLWSAGSPSPPPHSPDVPSISSYLVTELKNYKENRNKIRDLRHLEERILLDTLEDTDRKLGRSTRHPSRARSHLPLSHDQEVRHLQLEYENLKEKISTDRRQRPVMQPADTRRRQNYQPVVQHTDRRSRQDNRSVMSDASMSIHLDDDRRKKKPKEYQRYNPNQDSQLRQLAENHGRQMEYLQIKNRDLEKQREDIRRRLEELANKGSKPQPTDNTSQLLSELRAQEERNKIALDDLRRQLYDIHGQRVNFIEVEKSMQPRPQPQPPSDRKSYVYPVYYGNSLVAEISAMRQAYLQNGGNDPDVLAQMAQMQAEAQNIEDGMKQAPEKKDKKDHHSQLQMLELENERLHKELLLLQEQNFMNRKKSDREDELEAQLRRLQEEQLRKMMQLQNEIELLKQQNLLKQNARLPPPAPNNADMPWMMQRPYVDVEPMQPYDQYAGFVIFYDFVLNLEPSVSACRLIVGLHSTSQAMGEPTVLPTVYCEPATRATYMQNVSNAVIGARQPVPKCPPSSDLGIVVELQLSGGPASDYDRHSLITRAWVKIPIFDNDQRLMAGKFRIPFRNVPIKPFFHASQLQSLQKYGECELYYRLVNMRDMEIQSMNQISATNQNQYRAPNIPPPPPNHKPFTPQILPPPPSASIPGSAGEGNRYSSSIKHSTAISSRQGQRLPTIRNAPLQPQDTTIGFQVDRVKHAEQGEGKMRLTAYYASTGKVVQSSAGPVTCSTTAVRSNFKHGYHVFGQQEATFSDIEMQGDMILMARFYLRKRQQDDSDDYLIQDNAQEATLYDNETLVAWGAIPIVLSSDPQITSRSRRNFNPNTMTINSGTHTIKLFYPPAAEAGQIPFEEIPTNRDWKRYGRSTLRIHIFQGEPRPGSLTPSENSDDGEDVLPEYTWLPLERKAPPKDPFLKGDGFDVYIDGGRYFPDSVSFTKVAGRLLDRKYEVHGRDISTTVKLDSDIHSPVYEDKTEFRESNIPPSATLLLKIYTVDNFYKGLTVVGYSTLNIFVESGTERQPAIDKPGLQVSLNEGAHQLRLYSQGPNGVDPLTEPCLRDAGIRVVPCASLLVRITRVPKGPSGHALEATKVPQADWLRLGLWQPRPKYTDRIYYSSKCMPSKGESKLFHSMMRRPPMSNRDAVARMAQAKESFFRSDKNIEEFIRNKLTKSVDQKPLDQDLNFIATYSPRQGLKIAMDSAANLPWSNFTHAHVCLNPPGAFYLGAPHATYDKLTFTEMLDLNSTNSSPAWKDGFKHFPGRSFHRYLVYIIHLQEVSVTVARENYKYGLIEQAWTAVQVFTDRYAYTSIFQLPLYQGSPTPQMLKQLAREPCQEWMERNLRSRAIHLVDGASVFVRLSDARREDELPGDIAGNKLVEVNTDYIPSGLEEAYNKEKPGKVLGSLVPSGKTPEAFVDGLALKFKNLVYKLYEDNGP